MLGGEERFGIFQRFQSTDSGKKKNPRKKRKNPNPNPKPKPAAKDSYLVKEKREEKSAKK